MVNVAPRLIAALRPTLDGTRFRTNLTSRHSACWRRPGSTVELRGHGEYTLDRRRRFDLAARPNILGE